MKLVKILARKMKEWPEGASLVVQDYDGEVKYQFSEDRPDIENGRVWIRTMSDEPKNAIVGHYMLSSDYDTAVITREMWEVERAKLNHDAEQNVAALVEALEELIDLVEDIRDGSYIPDSFTLQPARAALAAYREQGDQT